MVPWQRVTSNDRHLAKLGQLVLDTEAAKRVPKYQCSA